MGKDGFAQAAPLDTIALPLEDDATLEVGTFYSAGANTVFYDTSQSAFAGAHSDIRKPEASALIAIAAAKDG